MLDDLMNNPIQPMYRLTSDVPKDGYFWKSFQFIEGGYFEEGDDLFRSRMKQAIVERGAPPR
jgi:hypothetical protein